MATATIAPPPTLPIEAKPSAPDHTSFRRRHAVLWRMLRHKTGLAGGGLVLIIALGSIFAAWIAPFDPVSQNLGTRLVGVGEQGYLLGSDAFGRDMLSRLIWGGQISLIMGVVASVVAMGIGVPLGMLAGYRGGWFDARCDNRQPDDRVADEG